VLCLIQSGDDPSAVRHALLAAVCFYSAMLRRARYCYGKSSVCLSVRNVEVL